MLAFSAQPTQEKIPPTHIVTILNNLEHKSTYKYEEILKQRSLPTDPYNKRRRLSVSKASEEQSLAEVLQETERKYGLSARLVISDIVAALREVKNNSHISVYEHGEYMDCSRSAFPGFPSREGAPKCQLGILARKPAVKVASEYELALAKITGLLNRYYTDQTYADVALIDIKRNCILSQGHLEQELLDDERTLYAELNKSSAKSFLLTIICDEPASFTLDREEQEEYIKLMQRANSTILQDTINGFEHKLKYSYHH